MEHAANSLFAARTDAPRVRPRLLVWLELSQADFVGAVADAARLEIVAAGSPSRGQAASVAAAFRAVAVDDLRNALSVGVADEAIVWIVATGGFGADPADVRALQAAIARGVRVVSSAPVPASVQELSMRGWIEANASTFRDTGGGVDLVPRTRAGDAWTELWQSLMVVQPGVEPIAGVARLATIESACRPEEGSLPGLLIDAIDIAVGLMGEPEVVCATYLAPSWSESRTGSVQTHPPETLSGLRGEMILLLEFADGRAATIIATDVAPVTRLHASLYTLNGRIELDDARFTWIPATAAAPADSHGERAPPSDAGVRAVAASLRRALAGDRRAPPASAAITLAVAQAALLSARTRGPARPGVFISMVDAR